jgi:hypothetical protein
MKISRLATIFSLFCFLFASNTIAKELSDKDVIKEVKSALAKQGILNARVITEEGEKTLLLNMPKIENTFGLEPGTVYSMWATGNAFVALAIAKKGKDFKKVKIMYDLRDKDGFCPVAIAKMSNYELCNDKKITMEDFIKLIGGKNEKCQ